MAKNRKPQKALNAANEKPSIIVQNLTIRPANRKTQDIGTWRRALQAAEATNERRTELYDLYNDILLDGHLDSIVEKRIMAVTNADWQFVKDGKVIEKVNNLIDTLAFEDLLRGIIESKFWGYSMMEVLFGKDGTFTIYDVPKKHMRPKSGLIAHEQTGDAGINIREGIYLNSILEVGKPKDLGKLLKAAQYAIYKRGDFGDWSQFVEIFGMPFREGVYDGYDENQRARLEEALEKMGGAAYVVLPSGSSLKLHENKTNSDGQLYNLLKDACNAEMSKLILGQTMTTENGSSRSQGEVHKDVEESINLADIIFTRRVLNSKVIKLLQANGFDTQGGWFTVNGLGEERLGKKEKLDIYKGLKKDCSLPIDDDFLYEEFGVPKPANYEELKAAQQAIPALTPSGKEGESARKPKSKAQKPTSKEQEEGQMKKLFGMIQDFFA